MIGVLRIEGEPAGPGAFLVASASEKGIAWIVEWQHAECRWCACPKFTRDHDCRHVDAAEALWRKEHEDVLAARRNDPAAMARVDERLKQIADLFAQ